MEVTLSLILAILSVGWQGVESFSGGAPLGACNTLSPDPSGHQNAQPQTTQVPYSVDLSPFTSAGGYTPGQTYTLTLSGNSGEQFKGLLIQTRTVAGNSPVGTFTVTDAANTRLSSCSPSNIGITHSNNNDKTSVSFQWTAPPQGTGTIQFRFAVVQVRTTYWANQASAMVQELVVETGTTTVAGGVTGEATTATGPTDTPTTNAQTTMMATSTGVTDEPGTATDTREGESTTTEEPDSTAGAMKQSSIGFWTLTFLMIIVGVALMKSL